MLQEIYREIEEETQIEDHLKYGMFVFVIMSMGQRGDLLLDCNSQPIDLLKIKDLLSSSKFPAMKGKPKLVIVQACSGSKYCIYNSISSFLMFIYVVSIPSTSCSRTVVMS